MDFEAYRSSPLWDKKIIMSEETKYNPDTVGTAAALVNYGEAIEHLRNGGIASREGWNGKGMYVFKQVPSKVPAEIVPKMSSLPQAVKDRMTSQNVSPSYQNQMAIVKADGTVDSWVASSSDTFATDWVLS